MILAGITTSNREGRRAGVTDIARRAGLSISTVSLALRDSSLVKQATKDKVLRLARDLKYVPNLQARSLRTQRTNRIAVLLPELDNPFHVEKLNRMQQAARDAGYELAFACTEWEVEVEKHATGYFLAQQVDAIIVGTLSSTEDIEHLQAFTARNRPVCVLQSLDKNVSGISTINVDRAEGMYKATKLLLDMGHRSFAIVGLRSEWPHMDRLEGINRALREAGLDEQQLTRICSNGDNVRHGHEAISLYLKRVDRSDLPTAVLALNDAIGMGVLSALAAAGLRVPQDVSVVGFDNIELASHTIPALTTVNQFPREVGQMAIEIVVEQLAKNQIDEQHLVQVPELVVRESTGPATKK